MKAAFQVKDEIALTLELSDVPRKGERVEMIYNDKHTIFIVSNVWWSVSKFSSNALVTVILD